jgi:hypothetical protein
MSRSRIDYDKGRRNRLGLDTAQAIAQERAQSDDPSAALIQEIKGERLKPLLVQYIQAKGPKRDISHLVANLIRRSKIRVFAEESAEGGNVRYECEMKIRHGHEAHVDSEQLQFLLNQLAERYDFIGGDWTLYFWLPITKPLSNE